MKFTMLGSGASLGVPVPGCDCSVCNSSDEKNKRMRSSAMIEDGDNVTIIDTSPDFRWQALRFGIKKVDNVLYYTLPC